MSAIVTCDSCGKVVSTSFELIKTSPKPPLTGWWSSPGGYDACCNECYDILLKRTKDDESCAPNIRALASEFLLFR